MLRSTPSPSSSSLYSSDDSPKHFGSLCTGTHKVHYQPQQQWDFISDTDEHPVDVSLVLPHYRARNQPTGHRMSMYIHGRGEIKSVVCRQSSRTPFFLCVHSSSTAPVTLCLPSDFSGKIGFSSPQAKVSLSPGFSNKVISRVRFARISSPQEKKMNRIDEDGSDEVEIHAAGNITLRIWDVVEGAPESVAREAWRKMCRRATSSKNLRAEQRTRQAIDWDFLLED
jgi:hypothetical protein